MKKSSCLLAACLYSTSEAFAPTRISNCKNVLVKMCPGGWGIGTPLDFQDEEYSNSKTVRRKRRKQASSADDVAYGAEAAERAANKYALEDSVSFTKRIQSEKENLQSQKKKDLLKIAKIAGLGDRLKPKVNNEQGGKYGKFEDDVDDFYTEDDGDNLDVRVY
uniref:Uncharacterized protein n=1 Tax=Chaetoceros debilis TaxID=122233 RepID=A0A7S3QAR1_9STRA|mmetsp:Transcript_8415/g.11943  ORF Transcript_8415/g.11943 Transcript_8415/m.11943 type:complete len:163 (+) Transcript_8415:103-591(+)